MYIRVYVTDFPHYGHKLRLVHEYNSKYSVDIEDIIQAAIGTGAINLPGHIFIEANNTKYIYEVYEQEPRLAVR